MTRTTGSKQTTVLPIRTDSQHQTPSPAYTYAGVNYTTSRTLLLGVQMRGFWGSYFQKKGAQLALKVRQEI